MKRMIGFTFYVIRELQTEWRKASSLAELSCAMHTKKSNRSTLLNPWRF